MNSSEVGSGSASDDDLGCPPPPLKSMITPLLEGKGAMTTTADEHQPSSAVEDKMVRELGLVPWLHAFPSESTDDVDQCC